MADPFIAEIRMFGGPYAPRNWTLCEGQLMQISQYSSVYALVGVMYGGDGRTTFGIPNMKGRAPMHVGTGIGLSPRTQGQMIGYPTVLLNETNLPPHTHHLNGTGADGNSVAAQGKMLGHANKKIGPKPSTMALYNPPNPSSETPMASEAIAQTGGGQAHENRQPFLGINFIFSLSGTFPSRN